MLQVSSLHEAGHLIYASQLLQNSYNVMYASTQRLNPFLSLVFAHFVRGLSYPTEFTYPLISQFLLQRMELDLNDVPMLYGLLYSCSGDWRKERSWILRIIASGTDSSDAWHVLRRRYTWDLLASLSQSNGENCYRRNMLEVPVSSYLSVSFFDKIQVLSDLSTVRRGVHSLVLESNFLGWVETQISAERDLEVAGWVRILENIATVMSETEKSRSYPGLFRCLQKCFSITTGQSRMPLKAP